MIGKVRAEIGPRTVALADRTVLIVTKAGRAEQRDADNKAMDEGRKAAREVQQQAAQKHAQDDTDNAFDQDFFRKD